MRKHLVFLFAFCGLHAFAQLSEAQIDALAWRALQTFEVPGIAVAVIKDGKVIHSKGYGQRSLLTHQKVDANTLFGIASNSKAFTTAALAMLVDEGKISWDDKVLKYIPEFKMYNDYVTNEFTVRDLLTHRSGLGLGAGDLMIWPDGNNFDTSDIIRNIQYLKPVSAFRAKYDYDNLLYIIAGEVIHRASGKTWAEFVEERIMKPLQMNQSAASFTRLNDTTNVVAPHVPTDGKLKAIVRYKSTTFDPAAGIYTSVNDLSKWVIAQLDKGKYGENQRLFSEKQQAEMWTPQTVMPNNTAKPYDSHFKCYGLGWQLTDVKGKLQVSHTGGLDGMVTQVTLLPELNLGIIVLTNQQSSAAFLSVTNTIKDSYLGMQSEDYVTKYSSQRKAKEDDADKISDEVWQTAAKNLEEKTTPDLKQFTGTYHDNWFGDVTISEKKGKLYFNSKRSPRLAGEIFFYKDLTFAVKWNNRSFLADAFLTYSADRSNVKMKPISPLTDFSYDFQDLDFNMVRQEAK